MKTIEINKAISEARRFITAAQKFIDAKSVIRTCGGHEYETSAPKESGALRRASLDLTRQLSVMRKP